MIRLKTLGELTIETGGRTPGGAAAQRRPLAILAVISAAGDTGITRDRLLGFFWPESSDERARNTLKQTLYALRRDLGEGELLLGTQDLHPNPERLTSDVAEFERAVGNGDHAAAFALYGGPFLSGINPGGSPELDQWIDAQRARLATMFAASAEHAAAAAADAGDDHGALLIWRRLAAQDPFSARATIGLMRATAAAGDAASAIQQARVYELLVRNELGAEPDAAVLALVATLRRGRPPETQPVVAITPPPSSRAAAGVAAAEETTEPAKMTTPAKGVTPPVVGADGDTQPTVPTAPPLPAAHPVVPGVRPPRARRWGRRRSAVMGSAAVVAMIAISGMLSGSRSAPLDSRELNEQRYAVLPCAADGALAATEALTPAECELLFHDALQGWRDVDLADELRLRDAVMRAPDLSIDERLAAARALGARYAVVPTIRPGGGTPILRAALYDVGTGRLLNRATTTLGRSVPESGRAMRALIAELLGGSGEADGDTPLETASLTAWQRYSEGRDALGGWDIAAAREAFAAAVAADSGYVPARYWLAQVEHWIGERPRAERQALAGRAAAGASRLTTRDRARALALNDLLSERYQDACVRYDSLVRADSLDVIGWLGRGDCHAQDDIVVPDDDGGVRFRGSYHAAIESYTKVLASVPTAMRMFQGERFERLMSLFFVDPHLTRRGRSANDQATFVGFPSISGDTLAFVPLEFSYDRPVTARDIPASRPAAIMANRRRLVDVTSRWAARDASNAWAHEAHALALEALGELKAGGDGASEAVAALERAGTLAQGSAPADRFRLAIIDVRMRLKLGQYDEVRTRGDALLRAGSTTPQQAAQLAAVAALLGRVDAALALASAPSTGSLGAQQRALGVTLSPRVEELVATIPLLATLPGYEARLDRALADLEQLLSTELGSADRVRAYPVLIGEAAHYGMLRMPRRVANAFASSSAASANRMVAMQLGLQRGDSPAVAAILTEVLGQLDEEPLDGVLANESLSLADIALAAGDSAAANRLVTNAIAAIPALSRRMTSAPHRAIAVPLLLARQARLAAARGDAATSDRLRGQLDRLWATADRPLREAAGLP